MDVSPMITPELWLTTLWVASNTPITIFHVLLTMRMAKADLKIQRKNMEVSKPCILFFSVIIWITSWHITRARIAAAMGSTYRFGKTTQHIENAAVPRLRGRADIRSDFAHLGVHVIEQAERLPVMPSIKMPFIHFSMISLISKEYLLPAPSRFGGERGVRILSVSCSENCGQRCRTSPSSPESRGTRVPCRPGQHHRQP